VRIDPGADRSKTLVFGPGLENGILDTEPQHFFIEPRGRDGKPIKNCKEPFDVSLKGNGRDIPVTLTPQDDGRIRADYQPEDAGPYHAEVKLKDEHVAKSPYDFNVAPGADHSKTLVYGPGLENGILDTQPQHFFIEPRDKRGKPIKGCKEPFTVTVKGPNGNIPVKVVPDGDKLRVEYQPDGQGNHHIEVKLKDDHVADSPYDVSVESGAFAGTSLIKNFSFVLETRTKKDAPKKAGGETNNITIKITGPGSPTWQIEDQNNGEYLVNYELPSKGKYEIHVQINGQHVKGSPMTQQL